MQVSHTMGIEFSFALSVVDDPTDILDDTVRVYSCLISIHRDLLHLGIESKSIRTACLMI